MWWGAKEEGAQEEEGALGRMVAEPVPSPLVTVRTPRPATDLLRVSRNIDGSPW